MRGSDATSKTQQVIVYSVADVAADKQDRKSVMGGGFTIDEMPISWTCNKQTEVSLSTMEAEYTAASVMGTELLGIRALLQEIGLKIELPMSLCADNQAAVKQLGSEATSAKANHVDVRIKFVNVYAEEGLLKPEYCEGVHMLADLLTKALEAPRLLTLRGLIALL
ncbi:polyprotein [Phytophthora megakarya]|uniref:Polyprotein n=1 Tax=Phytophthora megakarya TaxID=4795 RepID=A0A225WPH5_9STRA|nr:polyprotein [Phytophthora megakarya]